ncbi:hypothetical protein CVT26_011892 [Gymnopilus dilepis]|uniref:Uncharacterized protein n=1 Tax=Gymnopilus dilepis TaxID=231916 RepID=A0A409W5G4_9AGAR|nr:hypothetical protein CVT26_011892 [Gymnopilus dilepis]
MVVITDRLTTGQITFILRVAVQALSYGGLFLIGLIILANTPRVAPLETHDVLNRVVGKSTSLKSSLKWIAKRVFGRARDPASSFGLLLALAISICYGLFVSLSDIGFIGLHSCTVAGSDLQAFPASIQSDADALAVVASNMINGTDPHFVHSYRCDAASIVRISENVTERICSQWHNSTFGDPNDVRSLNSTDSDVLMARHLAKDNGTVTSQLDLNLYFVSATGSTVTEPRIQSGLGVFPHDTGVRMIVGVPELGPQQRVHIPKTLALEGDMGCMPLGTIGEVDPAAGFDQGADWFIPDSIYQPMKLAKYTGPDGFQGPLGKAADAIRKVVLPHYNTSNVDHNGYYTSFNGSTGLSGWVTQVTTWYPPSNGNITFSPSDEATLILGNCTADLNQLLNVTILPKPITPIPSACVFLTLTGSFFSGTEPFQGHAEFVCATATQVNMVDTTIETDSIGTLSYNITRLPSDLNIIQADYFDVQHNVPTPGDTTWGNWDPIYRYTLSDNPSGPTNHYIYQEWSITGATASLFSHGSGNIGFAFAQLGKAMISADSISGSTLGIINTTYFSTNNFTSALLPKWAGGVGASFILNSIGYNGWAARGAQALTVETLGGHVATCYDNRYAIAFLPLVLGAVFIILWAILMLIKSRLRESKKLKTMYGGLAPTIVAPFFSKPSPETVLVWEHGPEPHLKPVVNGTPIVGSESETLVKHVQNDLMIVLSKGLTTGQITFIFRVVIQALSYLGVFLLTLLVLGTAPRIAPLDTHDLLNRVVGKSTSTPTALKWIVQRVFRRRKDPVPSFPLAFALALSLCFGLFVSLSDIGLIGLRACTVPGSSFQDFPASVKSDSDALAVVSSNLLNGTDPHTVKYYLCDSAQDVHIDVGVDERICTSWHNSTYGDESSFRNLNSTDSAILMPRYLAHDQLTNGGDSDLNTYLVSASGTTVLQPTIQSGLAFLPHTTGVKMIVGVPQLARQQKVEVQKTLALEVEIGCMLLGTLGVKDAADILGGRDYFIPDSTYLSQRLEKYTGPEILKDPLTRAADAFRSYIRPYFNTSAPDATGYYASYNHSAGQFGWQTEMTAWFPPGLNVSAAANEVSQNVTEAIWANCTAEIHQSLNVDVPPQSLKTIPNACGFYQIRGSAISDGLAVQGHVEMVCATTTQVNMVSASLEMDADNVLHYTLTHLPSDLHITRASFFEIVHDVPNKGDITYANYDHLDRYALSDNEHGATRHYIFQESSIAPTSATFLSGAGSIGPVFEQVGSAMLGYSGLDIPSLGLISPDYFSANYSTSQVTRWAAGVGASFLLTSTGYNGWVARNSQGFTVVSTGGDLATCYSGWYAIAFLPLLIAAVAVILWTLLLFLSARIRKARSLKQNYGGLSPVIEGPLAEKRSPNTVLEWEEEPRPHLRPAIRASKSQDDMESEVLVSDRGRGEVDRIHLSRFNSSPPPAEK